MVPFCAENFSCIVFVSLLSFRFVSLYCCTCSVCCAYSINELQRVNHSWTFQVGHGAVQLRQWRHRTGRRWRHRWRHRRRGRRGRRADAGRRRHRGSGSRSGSRSRWKWRRGGGDGRWRRSVVRASSAWCERVTGTNTALWMCRRRRTADRSVARDVNVM